MTTVILIGNSDNKLTQGEWADYCDTVNTNVRYVADAVHFAGCPASNERWQNMCWVVELKEGGSEKLRRALPQIRTLYRQDSIAIIQGTTEFI